MPGNYHYTLNSSLQIQHCRDWCNVARHSARGPAAGEADVRRSDGQRNRTMEGKLRLFRTWNGTDVHAITLDIKLNAFRKWCIAMSCIR